MKAVNAISQMNGVLQEIARNRIASSVNAYHSSINACTTSLRLNQISSRLSPISQVHMLAPKPVYVAEGYFSQRACNISYKEQITRTLDNHSSSSKHPTPLLTKTLMQYSNISCEGLTQTTSKESLLNSRILIRPETFN